jgi:hypothetical protein
MQVGGIGKEDGSVVGRVCIDISAKAFPSDPPGSVRGQPAISFAWSFTAHAILGAEGPRPRRFQMHHKCSSPVKVISDQGENQDDEAQQMAEVKQYPQSDHSVYPGDGQRKTQRGENRDVDESHVVIQIE